MLLCVVDRVNGGTGPPLGRTRVPPECPDARLRVPGRATRGAYARGMKPRGVLFLATVFALIVAGISMAFAPRPPALPRGGREVFPAYRLFGYSGHPRAEALGRLGIGDINDRMRELEERGQHFRADRDLMPVMELITVIAQPRPGEDGLYRTRVSDATIESWLATAREHEAMLLLNIQPGRADFLDEVRHFERWLAEPDVGVALDPEWAVNADQVPGRVFGSTTGRELDGVAAWLSELVAAGDLPQKVMVYHQLHENIVTDEEALRSHPGVVLVKSVDGIGSPAQKTAAWKRLVARTPEHVALGFKLFYLEDTRGGHPLMTPDEVMALEPTPQYVLFE